MDPVSIVNKLEWINQVAGFVWVALTILMVLAIRELARAEGQVWQKFTYAILGLIALVWLYPLYTLGFQLIPGLIGNLVVLIATLVTALYVKRSSLRAALLLVPTLAWITTATVYVKMILLVQMQSAPGG